MNLFVEKGALAALLISIGLGLNACNLEELTDRSDAIRTRIAGIRAEPAELSLGETTELQALLVHEAGESTEGFGAIWFSCLEGGGATDCLGLDFSADSEAGDAEGEDSSDPLNFQFGVGETFLFTAAGSSIEAAWAALDPEDRVEGLSVLVSVNYVAKSNEELEVLFSDLLFAAQNGDEKTLEAKSEELGALVEDGINAARRIYISEKSGVTPDPSVDCPATELEANRNPSLEGLLLHLDPDGKDEGYRLGSVVFVAPNDKLILRPVLSHDSVEDYLYITTDGLTECRKETPYFAWVTNAGSIRNYSYTADEGDLDEVSGRLKTVTLRLDGGPDEDALAPITDLWLVTRDRRGGTDWQHWTLVVQETSD